MLNDPSVEKQTARDLLDYYAQCYRNSIGLKKHVPIFADSEIQFLEVLPESYLTKTPGRPTSFLFQNYESGSFITHLLQNYRSGTIFLKDHWLKAYHSNKKDYDLVVVADFIVKNDRSSDQRNELPYQPSLVFNLNDVACKREDPDITDSQLERKLGRLPIERLSTMGHKYHRLNSLNVHGKENIHRYLVDIDQHRNELKEAFKSDIREEETTLERRLDSLQLNLPENYNMHHNAKRYRKYLEEVDELKRELSSKRARAIEEHDHCIRQIKINQKKKLNNLEFFFADVTVILLVPKRFGEQLDYENLMSVIDRKSRAYFDGSAYFSLVSNDPDLHRKYSFQSKPLGRLSSSQKSIVGKCIGSQVGAIHGAPGTGKTHLVCELARQLSLENNTVLVTSRNSHALKVIEQKLLGVDEIDPAVIFTAFDEQSAKKRIFDFSCRETISKWAEKTPDTAYFDRFLEENGADLKLEFSAVESKPLDTKKSIANNLRKFFKINAGSSKQSINNLLNNYRDYSKRYEDSTRRYFNWRRVVNQVDFFEKNRDEWAKFLELISSGSISDAEEMVRLAGGFSLSDGFSIILMPFRLIPNFSYLNFDSVIIDEAGQCNIAESLPALLQADRLFAVGDTKQLKEVTFISKKQELQHAERLDLDAEKIVKFRDNSVLDFVTHYLTKNRPENIHTLTDQFRSPPNLIRFNIEEYYECEHFYYTGLNGNHNVNDLRWLHVEGFRRKGCNEAEALAVLDLIRQLIMSQALLPVRSKQSIGVISFFRGQADFLQKKILSELTLDEIVEHNVKVGTPFSFQGDEKDHIFISCAIDKQSHLSTWNYLNNPNIFNVTTSRAKASQTVVHSIPIEEMPDGSLIRAYYDFSNDFSIGQHLIDTPIWHQELLQYFVSVGFEFSSNVTIGDCLVNTVLHYKGKSIAVDFVGFLPILSPHLPVNAYESFHIMNIPLMPIIAHDWLHRRDVVIQEAIEWSEKSAAQFNHRSSYVADSIFESADWRKWISFRNHHSVDKNLAGIIESINDAIYRLLKGAVDEITLAIRKVLESLNKKADTFVLLYSQLFDENDHATQLEYWLSLREPIVEAFVVYRDRLNELTVSDAAAGQLG